MTDLSRRNFLKGLMATAGVVAAGMPVIAAVEAAAPPPLPFPDHLLGDVFIKANDVWRFLGKSTTWEVRVERDVDFAHLASFEFPAHKSALCVTAGAVDVDIMLDSEGRQLLMETFTAGNRADFALSQGEGGLYTLKNSFIRGVSSGCRRELVIDHFDLELGDEVEVTFPTAEPA
ncbi:twin-arginine translocation signal domain-containing protein [Mesorhizobium sp.]|uniref:twin-arginine translocation signal domain-containing protein n=1 Tax=Mesorhizobium sp. TaxID=1871066 RepID=UPI0025F9568D|nr:twin-arginine translocation signal domain-containing protein [Mesorhizobium sp.]